MRPPEFTGGKRARLVVLGEVADLVASMRPPEFTGGNGQVTSTPPVSSAASMRPPEFTGGNMDFRNLMAQVDLLQ